MNAMHHPAILRVRPQTRTVPPGFFLEFGSAVTRAEFVSPRWLSGMELRVQKKATLVEAPRTPPIDEEYFEWIDLLEAVHQARGQFVMVELGGVRAVVRTRGTRGAGRRPRGPLRCG